MKIENLRKSHYKGALWDRDDVVKEFESKYLLSPSQVHAIKSSVSSPPTQTTNTSDMESIKKTLFNMIEDLELFELLQTVDDHINTNRVSIDKNMNQIVSKAINFVEAEMNTREVSDANRPRSHTEKTAEYEYITVQKLKDQPPEDVNEGTALKLANLKRLLEKMDAV